MATTSLWKVDKRLDQVIDYATDEEKTKMIMKEVILIV